MKIIQMADAVRYARMTTAELRETFLLEDLFIPGMLNLTYLDLDRTVVGSAIPLADPIRLPTEDALKADYFTQRRELGVLNVGASGSVVVNEHRFDLDHLDALYVGRGNEHIDFRSHEPTSPAEFYLLSYPAHAAYPCCLIKSAQVPHATLGSAATANRRDITRLIHRDSVKSCQLVMGFTQLASGSVWNTMPPHTHMRRSEVYLYFDLPLGDRVIHLMGPAHETRTIIVSNKQAVVSPGWSIHAGVGTTNYSFSWGMGGENQDYEDMDRLQIADLL